MTLENDAGKPQIGACPLVKEPRGKRGVLFHAPSYDFGYPAIANPPRTIPAGPRSLVR
jgi:hypothetical protein